MLEPYTYVLTKKYPFVKTRPLTEIEIIQERAKEAQSLLVGLYPIMFIAWLIAMSIAIKNKLIEKIKT